MKWQEIISWLGGGESGMSCALCILAGYDNAFTGGGCTAFQIGKVKAHAATREHAAAEATAAAAQPRAAGRPLPHLQRQRPWGRATAFWYLLLIRLPCCRGAAETAACIEEW